jgi:hypothetical protein
MEVRQLQASRLGNEAPLRLDTGGFRNARESGMGQAAYLDRQVSDLGDIGSEFDVDRAVLGVAQVGAKLPR